MSTVRVASATSKLGSSLRGLDFFALLLCSVGIAGSWMSESELKLSGLSSSSPASATFTLGT